jgi:nucleoside-diphosphate-sugar epimerase
MDLKNKKVLVTGADGFIGSHLAEHLAALGCQVRAFVYYNSFNSFGWLDGLSKDERAKMEFFSGDIRDPHGVETAMKGIDMVFHLAALIGIPFSYYSPDAYVDTNIKGTLNILQAARKLSTPRVLVTSTSEVYGTARYAPIDEEHPYQGQSPYSATKIGADRLAESFFRSFELSRRSLPNSSTAKANCGWETPPRRGILFSWATRFAPSPPWRLPRPRLARKSMLPPNRRFRWVIWPSA